MKPLLNVLPTLAMVTASATLAAQAGLPSMPPNFSEQETPEKVLRAYPLGVITKQAAFVHHGKAVRTLILPNGKEGWVYEVGGKQAQAYVHPTGEKHTVYETAPGNGIRTYTLEFDSKGVVIDVLYSEQGRHDGLTALQVQRKALGESIPKGEDRGMK